MAIAWLLAWARGLLNIQGENPTETWGEGLVMTQQEKHVTWSSGGRVLDLEANDSRCGGGGGCWWWLVVVGVRFNCWHSNTLPQEMWIIKQHQEKSLCHHSERRKHLTNIHCVSCRKIVRHKYVKNEVDAQQAPKKQWQNWNLLRYRDRISLYILRSSPSQQQWGVQKYNDCAGECCWERNIQVYVNFGCILVQRTSGYCSEMGPEKRTHLWTYQNKHLNLTTVTTWVGLLHPHGSHPL